MIAMSLEMGIIVFSMYIYVYRLGQFPLSESDVAIANRFRFVETGHNANALCERTLRVMQSDCQSGRKLQILMCSSSVER